MFAIPCLAMVLYAVAMPQHTGQDGSGHLHVVIINGGMNKLMNHERYWNDCAFLYRTLRQDYHIPKRHFTLLISDGGHPGKDMLKEGGTGFASSPDDLDGDDERDVWHEATMANVTHQLDSLSICLTHEDHLFVFLMDHGGTNDNGQSYAYLWGGNKLNDTELASLLNRFRVQTMCVVMGQCYSGGFIDNLEHDGRVIATACQGSELSWSCLDKPYDEFAYHWISAVAGHDEMGNRIDADANEDGLVSMEEAFSYAQMHDSRDETPQYRSVPETLGGQWTFAGLIGSGIVEIETDAPNPQVYTLTGIPVTNSSHGFYIIKGKKMFKKP